MSRSVYVAVGIVAVLMAYFGIRAALRGLDDTSGAAAAESLPTLDAPLADDQTGDAVRVVVQRSAAQIRPLFLSLKGRTEAARIVTARAETTGVVSSTPVDAGDLVSAGDVLCALDVEDRQARVREAQASVASRKLDFEAAESLADKGWSSPSQAASAKADLDAAQASLQVAQVELDKTKIRAPFDGVFETRDAEIGDFLSPGGACGVVIELDPILMTAEASEDFADAIFVDSPAAAIFTNGDEVDGAVRFVARSADPLTRTFRIEVAAENADGAIRAGRTADIRVQIGEGPAHKVSPALLTLNDSGQVGVRYLDAGSVVQFAPARVVDDDQDGVWIGGLPDDVLLLVEGQDYVQEGLVADPVYRGGAG